MIFITGCNGLVGSYIARELIRQNYKVKALKRKNSNLTLVRDIADKIEWVDGDINDIGLLEEILNGIDTVIHSAAIVSFLPSHKEAMFRTNVDGTSTLVNAAIKNNVKLFVHISSVAAIGRKKNLVTIDEKVYWENSSYNSNYAVSKYHSELEVWRGSEEGLRTIIVNPSIVLGPGDIAKGSTGIFKYGMGENSFFPDGQMNLVDVRDVAGIVTALLEKEEAIGERFILNGGTLSYKSVFDQISSNFDKKSPSIKVGSLLTEIAWRLAAFKSFITRKEPVLTKETARASRHNFYYDNSKICKLLNYRFKQPEETIEWVCRELKSRISN